MTNNLIPTPTVFMPCSCVRPWTSADQELRTKVQGLARHRFKNALVHDFATAAPGESVEGALEADHQRFELTRHSRRIADDRHLVTGLERLALHARPR